MQRKNQEVCTNDIFPKKKEEEEEKEDLIIKTEGNKIKLFLDNDDIKTTKENDIVEEVEEEPKEATKKTTVKKTTTKKTTTKKPAKRTTKK